jgi:hypothetical protein
VSHPLAYLLNRPQEERDGRNRETRIEGEIVFPTRTAIRARAGTAAETQPAIGDKFARESIERHGSAAEQAVDQVLDQVLADSFPASDPPSWNSGIARLAQPRRVERHAEGLVSSASTAASPAASQIIDVSQPARARPTFLQVLFSFVGAVSIALVAPFAILLIGLPIGLSVRGVLELFGWLFGVGAR